MLSFVRASSKRAERLLEDPKLEKLLLEKFQSWENDPLPSHASSND